MRPLPNEPYLTRKLLHAERTLVNISGFMVLTVILALGARSCTGPHPSPVTYSPPPDTHTTLIRAAVDAGIPPLWMIHTAYLESRFDHSAIGLAGECGIMQLNPRYHPTACSQSISDQAAVAAGLLSSYRVLYGDSFIRVRLAYRAPSVARRRFGKMKVED